MTKEKLCQIFERFAILSIKTSQCDELTVEEQHDVIVEAIEEMANTIIIAVKNSASKYSYN